MGGRRRANERRTIFLALDCRFTDNTHVVSWGPRLEEEGEGTRNFSRLARAAVLPGLGANAHRRVPRVFTCTPTAHNSAINISRVL